MTSEHGHISVALPTYEVGGEIGRGAWGVVLQATHRQLGRDVAIKQLPRAFASDPSVRRRFVTEARLLAALDHPHIVPIFDYVEQDGLCLLIMELLPGGTVWQRFTTSGLTVEAACSVALATASALGFAHAHGILHRDVKPENLLLTGTDTVKVSDFGIAKIAGGSETLATTRGEVLGTPAYMSPEQALGRELTPATDIYALGTVLYELLSGRLPFDDGGNALALLHRHVYEDPEPISTLAPDLPEGLCEVVMRCLAKDPGDRFQTAEGLGIAIADSTTSAWGPGWHTRTGLTVMASETVAAHLSAPRRRTLSKRIAAPTILQGSNQSPAVRPDAADDHSSVPLPSTPSRVVSLSSVLGEGSPELEKPRGWPTTVVAEADGMIGDPPAATFTAQALPSYPPQAPPSPPEPSYPPQGAPPPGPSYPPQGPPPPPGPSYPPPATPSYPPQASPSYPSPATPSYPPQGVPPVVPSYPPPATPPYPPQAEAAGTPSYPPSAMPPPSPSYPPQGAPPPSPSYPPQAAPPAASYPPQAAPPAPSYPPPATPSYPSAGPQPRASSLPPPPAPAFQSAPPASPQEVISPSLPPSPSLPGGSWPISPWPSNPPANAAPMAAPRTAETSFRSQVVMSLPLSSWPAGSTCTAQLVVDHSRTGPLTIRARDEPAMVPDAGQLATQVLAMRARQTPGFRQLALFPVPVLSASTGYESRFTMDSRGTTVAMFEHYLVQGGRAFVVACPEGARQVTESLRLRPLQLATDSWFEARFEIEHPWDWSVTEQASIRGNGGNHSVTAERIVFPPALDPGAWRRHHIDTLVRPRGAKVVERAPGKILHDFEGEVLTIRWGDAGGPMLTKLGLAVVAGQGFAVTITLPHPEQGWFPALAGQARLRPAAGAPPEPAG